tara:strand:- start:44 stop:439 length:396 start_codon:yes stop_codon:yes gene_type:complete
MKLKKALDIACGELESAYLNEHEHIDGNERLEKKLLVALETVEKARKQLEILKTPDAVSIVLGAKVFNLSPLQAKQMLRGMFLVGSDKFLAAWDEWHTTQDGSRDLEEWNDLQESIFATLGRPGDINIFDD